MILKRNFPIYTNVKSCRGENSTEQIYRPQSPQHKGKIKRMNELTTFIFNLWTVLSLI